MNVSSRWNTLGRRSLFCDTSEDLAKKPTAQYLFSEGIMQYVLAICSVNFWRRINFRGYNLIFFCLSAYMLGKIFMYMFVANLGGDIAFAVVYIYSAELFPTTVR